MSKGQKANTYADSGYAFLVLQAHAAVCKKKKLAHCEWILIKYHHEINWLLCAAFLPKEAAVRHCWGHQKGVDEVLLGRKADRSQVERE